MLLIVTGCKTSVDGLLSFYLKTFKKRIFINTIKLEFVRLLRCLACKSEICKNTRNEHLAKAAINNKLTLRDESIGSERD